MSLHFLAAERSGVENTKLSDYGPPKTVKHALGGKHVPVVLITVGADGKGWYWLPRKQFDACTEEFDPKKQTSTPFQA